MSVPQSVADVIRSHVTLEVEGIDRMYLNVYQPGLQLERHVFGFLREQRGQGAVSSRCFQAMTETFIANVEAFAQRLNIPLVRFEHKARKDDVTAEYRAKFAGSEGIYFIGKVLAAI